MKQKNNDLRYFNGVSRSNWFHVNDLNNFYDLCMLHGLLADECPLTGMVRISGFHAIGILNRLNNHEGEVVDQSFLEQISPILMAEYLCTVFEVGYKTDNPYSGSVRAVNYRGDTVKYHIDDCRGLDIESIDIDLYEDIRPYIGGASWKPEGLIRDLFELRRRPFKMPEQMVNDISDIPRNWLETHENEFLNEFDSLIDWLDEGRDDLAIAFGCDPDFRYRREISQSDVDSIIMRIFYNHHPEKIDHLPVDNLGHKVIPPKMLKKILGREVGDLAGNFMRGCDQRYYVLNYDYN